MKSMAAICANESFCWAQAKLEDSELQVKGLSRQVMALERAKVELEARNRQLEASARAAKDSPAAGALAAPGASSQVCMLV